MLASSHASKDLSVSCITEWLCLEDLLPLSLWSMLSTKNFPHIIEYCGVAAKLGSLIEVPSAPSPLSLTAKDSTGRSLATGREGFSLEPFPGKRRSSG